MFVILSALSSLISVRHRLYLFVFIFFLLRVLLIHFFFGFTSSYSLCCRYSFFGLLSSLISGNCGLLNKKKSKKQKITYPVVSFSSLPKLLLIYIDGKETTPSNYPIEPELVIDLEDFFIGRNKDQSSIYGKFNWLPYIRII